MKTDYTLLNALRQQDNKAIQFVYWDFFASVRKYILLHGGAEPDAEDVFQEALLVLLSNIQKPDFELSASIKTYHFAICKNIWKSKLRQRQPWSSLAPSVEENYSEQEEDPSQEEQWNSMGVVMQQITQFCSKFLTDLFTEGKLPHQYKNEHTFHNQKYKCLLQARKAAQKIKQLHG